MAPEPEKEEGRGRKAHDALAAEWMICLVANPRSHDCGKKRRKSVPPHFFSTLTDPG